MELPNSFFNHDAQAGGFYPRSHVGIDISGFGQNQNVLIEGIRGTGKTHVMKMIERFYFENFEDKRVLPIFVSLAQISEHARKDPEEFRLHLYTYIVQRCLETIEKYQDDLQPDISLLKRGLNTLRRLFGINDEQDISAIIKTLKSTAEQLLFELQFDLTSETLRNAYRDSVTNSKKIDSKIKASNPVVKSSLGAQLSEEYSYSLENEGQMVYMGNKLAHHNAANFILEFLKQVQVILDLEYSLILIDECSEATTSSQVEIFRLFKAIRGVDSRLQGKETCAYFIGSVYPRGETYYPSREHDGFEFDPGHDCTMEFLQWDEIDIETYISFFQEMTLSRSKEILGYAGDFDALQLQLFDGRDTFLLAAFCSHGIPRRYWEIIKRGYDKSSNKVIFPRVDAAIQEIANEQILAHTSIREEDKNFIFHLVRVLSRGNISIRRRNSKRGSNFIPQNIYFSINQRYQEMLRRLTMQGATHEKSRMRTISKPKRPQPMYAVDIALVYTFRIVPPKRLVAIITSDIPRAPTNDFDQSPEIKSKDITDIFVQGKEIILDKDIEDEAFPVPIVQSERLEGTVTIFIRGKNGRIRPKNGEEDLTFQNNNVELEYRDDLQAGDLVSFFARPSTPSPIATKIQIIKSIDETNLANRMVGKIIAYENKNGSIQPRGGGNIFTFQENNIPVYLRSILRVGDKVTFLPSIKGMTRAARNINIHDSLVTKNLSGSLKSVQPGKYCIVEVEDGGPYAYFSYDHLPASVATDLKPDMKIEFDLINTPTGRQAINVKVPKITYKVDPQQLNQLTDYVNEVIQHSVSPISLGLLADQIQNHFGDSIKNTQWLGYGSFKGLLQKLNLSGIEIVPIGPNYIYDPSRHEVPTTSDMRVGVASQRSKVFSEQHPEIFDLTKRIRPIIEIPLINTKDFQDIFNEIANEVNENGFHLSQTGKSVRDRCKNKGMAVNRSDISLMLRGIYYGGHSLGEGTENAKILGEAFVRNIVNLCKQSNLFFSMEEENKLFDWIVGDKSYR